MQRKSKIISFLSSDNKYINILFFSFFMVASAGKREDYESLKFVDIEDNIAIRTTNIIQPHPFINCFVVDEDGASELITSAISPGDLTIDVADGTPFTAGDRIKLINAAGTKKSNCVHKIISIATNTLTLNCPIDDSWAVGDSVKVVISNMNVDGSVTPRSFKLAPLGGYAHLVRMIIYIQDGTVMDDAKFGGMTALTKGVVIRVHNGETGLNQTITNWTSNGIMAEDMYDLTYTSKAPAGSYGLRGRWTITKSETIISLDGSKGDYIEVLIQDDLTDLEDFQIKIQGHFENGE